MKLPWNDERGASLVVMLLLITVISLLGASLFSQVMSENKTVEKEQDDVRAMYAAEAGCIEVVSRLADYTSPSYIGPSVTSWSGQPGWGLYFRPFGATAPLSTLDPSYSNTANDNLDNNLDGHKDEAGETYPVRYAAWDDSVSFSWARASFRLNPQKKILLYGDNDGNAYTAPVANLSVGQPILIVTASATVGLATRTVEMECVKWTSTSPYQVKSRRKL